MTYNNKVWEYFIQKLHEVPIIKDIPKLPTSDNPILYGLSLTPYLIASRLALQLLFNIGKKDVDQEVLEKTYEEVTCLNLYYLTPFTEELIFRVLPSYIGKFFGGDVGEVIALLFSNFIFSLIHLPYYKNKKIRAFMHQYLPNLFLVDAYLKGGLLSSFYLHSMANISASLIYRLIKKIEKF